MSQDTQEKPGITPTIFLLALLLLALQYGLRTLGLMLAAVALGGLAALVASTFRYFYPLF